MASMNAQGNVFQEIVQIKKAMSSMQHELNALKETLQERLLSEDDRKAIDETLKAEKQGKLRSMKAVFG
jgi:hypothetical protein